MTKEIIQVNILGYKNRVDEETYLIIIILLSTDTEPSDLSVRTDISLWSQLYVDAIARTVRVQGSLFC